YAFFKEYGFNYDIYENVKGSAGDYYDSSPSDVIPEDRSDSHSIKMDCLRLNKYLIKFENNEQCQDNNCCGYVNYFLNKTAPYNKILTTYKKPDETIFCKALKNFAENLEANNFTSKIKCKQLVVSIGYQTGQTETQMESEGPSDPQKDKVVEIQANDTTSPRSFVTTLPISLFSSGAGVLLILLSFHKFTPLGQWLKHQTQRFGAITKNSDEELYEMQQPNSEYDERNTEYNVYNIAYNSL
ncbi:PIR Superfamily Protein, partial [Plasmodium ovale curtisi]